MPDRVKCLHVLAGQSLAQGRGVNPLGDEVLDELGAWWQSGPCVTVDPGGDLMTRVAAFDCGTNSLRLLIADLDVDAGTSSELVRELRIVRLGQGVDRTGRIAEASLQRVFTAVEEYMEIVLEHDVAGDPVLRDLGRPRRRERRRVRRGRAPARRRGAGGARRSSRRRGSASPAPPATCRRCPSRCWSSTSAAAPPS